MSYKKIRKEVEKIVKEACFSSKNKFKNTVWKCHFLSVVGHGLNLGKKFKADLEIIELSALLHDYANLMHPKYVEKHHLHSAEMAEKILTKLKYDSEKINHIRECIISHRGSVKIKHKSIESKILASADAMSHITELADMFYLTFGVHKYETFEGAKWLKDKINRSWSKTMPEGKRLIKQEYYIALKIMNKAIR